ncbi:Hypothetical predicted protein [Mytilus galloprovincialis]|uniref:Uncharacterized protein n=1 Tax=Mytilus galloprovincialis TaxID=29158 RepID=A0A8B6DX44_MYTGA|nr:Hypothetical predicted protein [Mytilus galloprovincialis]
MPSSNDQKLNIIIDAKIYDMPSLHTSKTTKSGKISPSEKRNTTETLLQTTNVNISTTDSYENKYLIGKRYDMTSSNDQRLKYPPSAREDMPLPTTKGKNLHRQEIRLAVFKRSKGKISPSERNTTSLLQTIKR